MVPCPKQDWHCSAFFSDEGWIAAHVAAVHSPHREQYMLHARQKSEEIASRVRAEKERKADERAAAKAAREAAKAVKRRKK